MISEMNIENLFAKGVEALKNRNSVSALVFFEKAFQIENNPLTRSYLAYCLAKERGQIKKAISFCEESINEEPENPIHYLNLGRVYLLNGNKEDAVRTYREGLRHGDNQEIKDELNKLGIRKSPIISFLKRGNPINRYLGFLLTRLGFR